MKPKTIEYEGKKIVLFLDKDLYPEDTSFKKLYNIIERFEIKDFIIALPDLHFKVKNFVPSGMVIPLENSFSYFLLGPNNDGIGALKIRLKNANKLSNKSIINVFHKIMQKIMIFRREKDYINKDTILDIFKNGITNLIKEEGFKKEELSGFEDEGCLKIEDDKIIEELQLLSNKKFPKTLPAFVPNTNLVDRGKKTLAVLDGTSHFIELYQLDKIVNSEIIKKTGINEKDLFFLVHAGGGDVSIVLHRLFLEEKDTYNIDSDLGEMAHSAIKISANFGFANRFYIYSEIAKITNKILELDTYPEIFFDAPHDYLEVSNNSTFIHRKGAVKLLPFNNNRNFGNIYIFPTYPGGKAFLLWKKGENMSSMHYISHGAGRKITKDKATQIFSAESAKEYISDNTLLFRYGFDNIEGQHPKAFKDYSKILNVFKQYELAEVAGELKPIASLKT